MRNIEVTMVDVGAIGDAPVGVAVGGSLRSSVDEWTPGEQTAYSAVFGSVLEDRAAIRGDRIVVGAGASVLEPSLLPQGLISIPNTLVPIASHVIAAPPVSPALVPGPAPQPTAAAACSEKQAEGTDSDHEPNSSDTGSEADVESNEGYGSGVGESRVSLKSKASRPDTA
ncbi:hypothetical protein LXA43DRAFT_1094278 [Ganoderma leucocontextum]|nr:hypothetical protein LXA43DRAFT_1094278 [Ganoderma leucocontextum]